MRRLISKQELAKELGKETQYLVSFDGETIILSKDELINFTKITVISNRDIKNYTVTRI